MIPVREPIKCEDRQYMYLYRGFIIKKDAVDFKWVGIPALYPVQTEMYSSRLAKDILEDIDLYWSKYRDRVFDAKLQELQSQ